jgi:hypothetical protein
MTSMSSRTASEASHSRAARRVSSRSRDGCQPFQAEGDVDLLPDLSREARAFPERSPRQLVVSFGQGYRRQRVQIDVEDVPGPDLP